MKLEGPVLVVCIPVLLAISLESFRTVTSKEVVDSPLLKEIERKKAFLYKRPPTVLISSPRNAKVGNNGTKTGGANYWSGGRYPPVLPFQNASYQFAHDKVQISNSTPGVLRNATKPRNNQTRANDRIFMPPYKLPFWGMPYGIYSNGGLVNPGLFPFVPGGPAYPPFDGVFGGPFGPGQYPGPSLNPFPPGTGTPMFPGGQPPLNPTGPPIGAFGPGSPIGYPKPVMPTTPKPKEKPKPSKAPKKPKQKPKAKPKPHDTEDTGDSPPPKYPKTTTTTPPTTTTTTPRPHMPDPHTTPCPYHHHHPSSTPQLCPYNHPHPPHDDMHHNHKGHEKPLLEPSSADSHQQLAAHSHYHPQSVPAPVNIYDEYHSHESNNHGYSGSNNGHYSSEPINTMNHYPPVKMKRCRLKHRPPTPQFHDVGYEMREPAPTYHPSTKRPCPYRRFKPNSKNETYKTEESRTTASATPSPISMESHYESYGSENDARYLPAPQEHQHPNTHQEIHYSDGSPPVSHEVVLYKPNPQEIIQTPTSVTVPLPFPIWNDNQSQQAMQNQPSQVTYKVDLNSDLLTKITTPVHIPPPAPQGQQFGQIISSSPYMFGSSPMSQPAQPLIIIDNSAAAQLPPPIMFSPPESVQSPLIQPVYDYYQAGSSPFPYFQQSALQTIPNVAESYLQVPSYASMPSLSDYGMLLPQGATDLGTSPSVVSPYQILYSNKEIRRQLTPEPNPQKNYVLISRDELEQLRSSYAAEPTADTLPSSSNLVPTIAYPPNDFDTFNPNLPLSFPNSYYQMQEPSYTDHSRNLYDLPLSFDTSNRAMDSFSLLDNISGRYNYRRGKSIDQEELNDSNENS